MSFNYSKMKNNLDIKVAILITTFNGSPTIGQTIEKVQHSILKYGQPVNVYIFDDCSDDNTVDVIHKSWNLDKDNLIIVRNSHNLGLFQNKNKGLNYLRNDYDWVLFMDQDDFPAENWISRLVEVITTNNTQNCLFIWSSYNNFRTDKLQLIIGDTKGNIITHFPTKENLIFWIKKIYTPFCISGSAINTKLLINTGLFNIKYNHFGDTDLLIRGMLMGFNHIYIASPLLVRSLNDLQASFRHLSTFRDFKEMPMYYNSFSKYLPIYDRFRFGITLLYTMFRRLCKAIIHLNFRNSLSIIRIFINLSFIILKNLFKN